MIPKWKLSLDGAGDKIRALKEKVKRLKEVVKFKIVERKQKWEAGAGKVADDLKHRGKEIVRVRNDVYFIGSGILGSVGICVSLIGRKCDKDLIVSTEQVQVMVTPLSLNAPTLQLNIFNLLLKKWNSATSKEKLKIIKRLVKIYSLSMEEANSWLSDILMSELLPSHIKIISQKRSLLLMKGRSST